MLVFYLYPEEVVCLAVHGAYEYFDVVFYVVVSVGDVE